MPPTEGFSSMTATTHKPSLTVCMAASSAQRAQPITENGRNVLSPIQSVLGEGGGAYMA